MFQEWIVNIQHFLHEFFLTANDYFSAIHTNPYANDDINRDELLNYETIYFEKTIDNDFEEDFEPDFEYYSNIIKNMIIKKEEKED
jgi:hypothetical protein